MKTFEEQKLAGLFEHMADDLMLSDTTISSAQEFYEETTSEYHMFDTKTQMGLAVHVASRRNDEPRSRKDIGLSISKAILGLKKENVVQNLNDGFKKLRHNEPLNDLHPIDAFSYAGYIADSLELDNTIRDDVLALCQAMDDNEMFTGRDPFGLAASAAYVASDKTLNEVGSNTVTCVATIRNISDLIDAELRDDDDNLLI